MSLFFFKRVELQDSIQL